MTTSSTPPEDSPAPRTIHSSVTGAATGGGSGTGVSGSSGTGAATSGGSGTLHWTLTTVDDGFLLALLGIGLVPVFLSYLIGLWVPQAVMLPIGLVGALVTMRLAAQAGIRAYQTTTDSSAPPPAARRRLVPNWCRRSLLWLLVAH